MNRLPRCRRLREADTVSPWQQISGHPFLPPHLCTEGRGQAWDYRLMDRQVNLIGRLDSNEKL